MLRIMFLRKCGRFHVPEPKRRDSPEPMAGDLPQRRHYQQKLNKAHYSSNDTVLKVDGKAVPLQAWSGPEGSRKLRFPDFMTTAQDGGQVVSLKHRPPLPPGNTTGTHFF